MLSPKASAGSRTIIVHQGALGDFIMALPALEGLYLSRPDTQFDFWSREEHIALIETKPYVGQVRSRDGTELTPFFHDELWLDAEPPAFFAEAREVFLFGQAGLRVVASRLASKLDGRVRWIQSFPDAGVKVHVSQFIVNQLADLGAPQTAPIPRIEPVEAERVAVKDRLGREGCAKPVVVHPGSGGRSKIWPLERWWALLRLLRKDRDRPVVLTLGPADDYLRDFAKATQDLGVRVFEGLTLSRLSALLAESSLYVGNDSGASHLAAAVGAPSVVIFGPTDPDVWGPRGRRVRIVQSEWSGDENLRPLFERETQLEDGVAEAVSRLLDSS